MVGKPATNVKTRKARQYSKKKEPIQVESESPYAALKAAFKKWQGVRGEKWWNHKHWDESQ